MLHHPHVRRPLPSLGGCAGDLQFYRIRVNIGHQRGVGYGLPYGGESESGKPPSRWEYWIQYTPIEPGGEKGQTDHGQEIIRA